MLTHVERLYYYYNCYEFKYVFVEFRHANGQTPHPENHQVPSTEVGSSNTCEIINSAGIQQTRSHVDCHSNEQGIKQIPPVHIDRKSSAQISERQQITELNFICLYLALFVDHNIFHVKR